MSSIHFSVKYDGPALATHEMDVRELAPALIALADMLKAANHTLFGEKADVQVNVKGTFNRMLKKARIPSGFIDDQSKLIAPKPACCLETGC